MPKKILIPIDASALPRSLELTIPDVVIRNTLSADGLTLQTSSSQADPTWKLPPATPIPGPTPTPIPGPTAKTYKMPRITGDISNYGRGMCDFGTPSFPTYKSKSIYDRRSWAQMQTQAGSTANFSTLKDLFEKAKTNKQTVNFRIGMFDSSIGWGNTPIGGIACYYPGYVHTIMQGEAVKDWNNGKIWFPNWNSPGMQKAWADFITLLVQWLKSNNYYQMLDFVDIGGYGDYESEWHMYGFDTVENQNGTKVTDKAQIFFIDTHMQTFTDIPCIGNQAMIDPRYAKPAVSYYALTVKNNFGLMGFRNDHIGWYDVIAADKQRMSVDYNGINFLKEYSSRYLHSPMIGEPMNNAGLVTPAGGTPYQTLINDVQDFGMCQFENKSSSTAAQINFSNACAATGQIGIDIVIVDEKGSAAISLFNTGKAPLYWPWKTVFIADGVKVSVIPAGAKTVSVMLDDPTGYREPFYLANTGRQTDGSYKIF